jgi:N-acetylneuraminic acid mutarotase
VWVFGGLPIGNTAAPKGLVEEYDIAANTWTKRNKMPLPAHHLAVTEYKGKLYVFGGGAQLEPNGPNWVPINNAWEYDPATDHWKALAPMPTARGAANAATVGDKIYVIGGASVHPGQKIVGLSAQTPHRALGTNEMYDPENNTWQERSPMPTSRNHAAIGVVNGKIYVLGGRLGAVFVNASPTDVVEEYDPATDSWGYAKAKMNMARSGTAYAEKFTSPAANISITKSWEPTAASKHSTRLRIPGRSFLTWRFPATDWSAASPTANSTW